ncbi:MAG: hypothetical protein IJQ81_04020 [Oscillibacter sp.]|nr:hypothetical protein [Oscillibacter sp.]
MTNMPDYPKTSCAGNCGNCTRAGNCGGNAGAGVLELTEAEIVLLGRFAQIPFWPVARRADSESPICLEEESMRPELLSALAVKGLIRLDFDLPLSNFDYAAYDACPHKGSMALTAAGQNVIELLDIQGAEE